MINTNQNLLFISTILALCVITFVHIFLFPLYDINAKHGTTKTFLDFSKSLCASNYKYKKVNKRSQCPQYGIVTIMQGGRLGNQMWEYASVWALARRTGLEPYVPKCLKMKLDQVFETLTVPTFDEIAHCPVDLSRFVKSLDSWNYTNQSIVLPRFSIQPDLVLMWVQDIIQEFTLRKRLIDKSQRVLRHINRKLKSNIFIGVHIRRSDYIGYLWRKYSVRPADDGFYFRAMSYFERKHNDNIVAFVIVSDDPKWCIEKFSRKNNVYVVNKNGLNSPAQDLAILASCNHSIFDYGTFGVWGAILAGGETIYYNLSQHSSAKVGQLLPNWRAIN